MDWKISSGCRSHQFSFLVTYVHRKTRVIPNTIHLEHLGNKGGSVPCSEGCTDSPFLLPLSENPFPVKGFRFWSLDLIVDESFLRCFIFTEEKVVLQFSKSIITVFPWSAWGLFLFKGLTLDAFIAHLIDQELIYDEAPEKSLHPSRITWETVDMARIVTPQVRQTPHLSGKYPGVVLRKE